jgi:hypothetical protein
MKRMRYEGTQLDVIQVDPPADGQVGHMPFSGLLYSKDQDFTRRNIASSIVQGSAHPPHRLLHSLCALRSTGQVPSMKLCYEMDLS